MPLEKVGHWYRADASACFEVPKFKGGGMRSVTIKDARALHLYPSVTTILSCLERPALLDWKLKQVAMAALTIPHLPGEDSDTFIARIIKDAFKQVEDAADLGTRIHKALELHFASQPYESDLAVFVQAVDKWMASEGVTIQERELRLVNEEAGYAGTTDLTFANYKGFGVGDYKTRKTNPKYPCTPYDGQIMQTAAYHVAKYGRIEDAACDFNLFISTTEPGRIEACWYGAPTLRDEYGAFLHVCALWRHLKQYDPRNPSVAEAESPPSET